eukprot:3829702-Pleurochrysis_carterae.AAC.1
MESKQYQCAVRTSVCRRLLRTFPDTIAAASICSGLQLSKFTAAAHVLVPASPSTLDTQSSCLPVPLSCS